MAFVVVHQGRTVGIVKATVFLFLTNLFWGGFLGFEVAYKLSILRDDPLYAIGLGIVFANVGTFLFVRALYERGARAVAPLPFPIGDFLHEVLFMLLGLTAGTMTAGMSLWGAWNTWMEKKSPDGVLLGLGIVALLLSLRATMQLVGFLRRTRVQADPGSDSNTSGTTK